MQRSAARRSAAGAIIASPPTIDALSPHERDVVVVVVVVIDVECCRRLRTHTEKHAVGPIDSRRGMAAADSRRADLMDCNAARETVVTTVGVVIP